MENIKIIGVCGKSGSGKSFCGAVLEKKGYAVIDSDVVYHSLLRKENSGLKNALEKEFGTSDRKKLAEIVFTDKKKLGELNNITHSHITKEILNRIETARGKNGFVFILAPLLFESGFDKMCDFTVGITAETEICLYRLEKREKTEPEILIKRLENQLGDDFITKNCDFIIKNDSDGEMEKQIDGILKALREAVK